MRITYMYYLLSEIVQDLEQVNFAHIQASTPPMTYYYSITNCSNLFSALNKSKNLDLFNEYVNRAIKSLELVSVNKSSDVATLNNNDGTVLNDMCKKIKSEASIIVNFLETYGFNREQKGFDIKIPPTTDFDEFADYVDSIRKILKCCPYLHSEEEDVKLLATDVGSIWLKFAVVATSTTLILNNLAVIVDHCVKIKSHIEICRQQEERVRTMDLKNDLLEDMIKNHKQMTDSLVDIAVKDIQNELNKENQTLKPEEVQKLKMTVEQLTNLMDKGLEIYSSIDAPNEIQDVLPTSNEVKTLPDMMKLLTESKDEENENEE